MSLFTIVGCGDSAKNWQPNGVSIGSNDCEKFGKPVDYLVLANAPHRFKERLATIKKSKAKVMVTSKPAWQSIFPNCEQIYRTTAYNQRVLGGFIYTARTTPIMCFSLALRLGATEIIMWGVDMVNHKTYRLGTKQGDLEIATYKRFFEQAKKLGIKTWIGKGGTVFDSYLPTWPTTQP